MMLLDKKELAGKVFVVFALIVAWIYTDKLMTKVNAQARISTKTAVALLGALRFGMILVLVMEMKHRVNASSRKKARLSWKILQNMSPRSQVCWAGEARLKSMRIRVSRSVTNRLGSVSRWFFFKEMYIAKNETTNALVENPTVRTSLSSQEYFWAEFVYIAYSLLRKLILNLQSLDIFRKGWSLILQYFF